MRQTRFVVGKSETLCIGWSHDAKLRRMVRMKVCNRKGTRPAQAEATAALKAWPHRVVDSVRNFQ
jgi:hypothetical protein